jgi:hypothetical protein
MNLAFLNFRSNKNDQKNQSRKRSKLLLNTTAKPKAACNVNYC